MYEFFIMLYLISVCCMEVDLVSHSHTCSSCTFRMSLIIVYFSMETFTNVGIHYMFLLTKK